MALNESFWVVAGTAAPVLGLSAILAVGTTFRASLDLQDAADRDKSESFHFLVKAQLMMLTLAYISSIVSILSNGLVLALSLLALANKADLVSPVLATILLMISFVSLWFQVYVVGGLGFMPRSPGFVNAALRRGRKRQELFQDKPDP